MTYVNLREKSRYLKIVRRGAGRDLREDEITDAEEEADVIIEGALGKSWSSTNTPKLIEKIADRLASSKCWEFLHVGQKPAKSEYAKELYDKAMDLLAKIADGEMGLKLPDGTWDEDYAGNLNKEDKKQGGIEILI